MVEPASITTDSDFLFKIVMLGPSGAGKSNLVSRFINDRFNAESEVTIGVDFASKVMETFDGVKVKTQVWDTAGQERFRAMVSSYYRGAHGALLVYDITSRDSFEGAKSWLQELRQHRGKDIVLILVGNKLDLEAKREVPLEDALAFADKNDLAFMETSALTDVGVSAAFTSVIQEAYRNKRKQMRLEKEERKRKEAEAAKTSSSARPDGVKSGAPSTTPASPVAAARPSSTTSSTKAPSSSRPTGSVKLDSRDDRKKAKDDDGGCCS